MGRSPYHTSPGLANRRAFFMEGPRSMAMSLEELLALRARMYAPTQWPSQPGLPAPPLTPTAPPAPTFGPKKSMPPLLDVMEQSQGAPWAGPKVGTAPVSPVERAPLPPIQQAQGALPTRAGLGLFDPPTMPGTQPLPADRFTGPAVRGAPPMAPPASLPQPPAPRPPVSAFAGPTAARGLPPPPRPMGGPPLPPQRPAGMGRAPGGLLDAMRGEQGSMLDIARSGPGPLGGLGSGAGLLGQQPEPPMPPPRPPEMGMPPGADMMASHPLPPGRPPEFGTPPGGLMGSMPPPPPPLLNMGAFLPFFGFGGF